MTTTSTSPFRAAVLTVAASLLALTGCSADAKSGTDTQSSSQSSDQSSPTQAADSTTPEPKPESAPAIQDNGTTVKMETSGIVSWEVQPGKNLTPAIAKRIEPLADAFIDEHLLRPDRWQGKYAIKAGEMDAFKAKVTPKVYKAAKTPIDWYVANEAKYGTKSDKWPAAQARQREDRVSHIGYMLVTSQVVEGGKGLIKNEMTRKVIYSPSGSPVAYIAVRARRDNNTGTPDDMYAKLTFTKVGNRYLISNVYWTTED